MTTVLDIPLAQIRPHPANPRKNITVDADFDDLVASIRANGVEQPCFVVREPNNRRTTQGFWLVGGHRRHAASKVAKTKTLPAIVRDDLVTPGQQLRFMLSENLHRLDLSPIETGDAIQALLDLGEGFTTASVAKATGLSARTVKDRLKLASMPEAARERIHAGQVTIADGMAMSEFTTDPDTLATLTEAAGGADFAYQLTKARELKAGAAALAKATRLHSKGGGVVLTENPDNNDWSPIEEMDYYVETFRVLPEDEDADEDASWDLALELAASTHQTCPGHATIIETPAWARGTLKVTAICTDFDTHHPDTGRLSGGVPARTVTDVNLPRTPEQKTADHAALAAIDAATAARAEQRANLATAAKVRRAHLGTIVDTANPDLALKSLRATVKARIGTSYRQVDPTFAAQVLLDHPDAPHLLADHANLAKVVGYTINTLTLPALAILMSIFDGAPADLSLEHPSAWPGDKDYWPTEDRAKSWRKLLVSVYDYAWSPIERELLGETLDVDDETTVVEEDQAAVS